MQRVMQNRENTSDSASINQSFVKDIDLDKLELDRAPNTDRRLVDRLPQVAKSLEKSPT